MEVAAAMPIYVPLPCGCRIEVTAENSGSYTKCQCGKSVFVPFDVTYRFESKLDLEDVFKIFCEWFATDEDHFFYDAENEWEWFDGRSTDGRVGFNISRKHSSERLSPKNPVVMSLLLHDERLQPDFVGQSIANAFAAQVICTSPNSRYDGAYAPGALSG